MILECKVIHTLEIGLHSQFIGQMMDVKVEQSALNDAGLPDTAKVAPFIYRSERQTYQRIGGELP
jgi:flavin reductase (DIM6/NTAB) family NADH-FMN oxidoreductase RutF